ncbi:MAG: FlgD immunoglobulin-like domain containing protein [Bacteroidia bacterium]
MKKIYITIITMFAVAAIASAQTTITLRVDMSSAMLGENTTVCTNQVPFDPATDVVEAMGADFNNWSAPETVNCGDPFTADPTVDFSPVTTGSLIYQRTFSLATIANPADMPFKFRIDHSWDNDELRMVGDGNRHLDISTIGGIGGNYVVDAVFDVDGITVTTGINEINANYFISMAPNPVKADAKFNFTLLKNYNVVLKIYDLLGKEVKTVVAGDLNAGNYQYVWNADNNNSAKLNNGCYFYSLYLDNTKVKTDKIYIIK